MSQKEIELILMRQLASYLATPVFLVDMVGTLVFYNEPAEAILGRRFQETDDMSEAERATIFTPTDEHGQPLHPSELPLVIALAERRPVFRRLYIRGLDGVLRHIEVTAFPLIAPSGQSVGGVAIFWEATAT